MTSTAGGGDTSLRSLRDRPFELLKELEKRSRTVTAANAPEASAGSEWVGVACRMGGETFGSGQPDGSAISNQPLSSIVT